VAKPSILPRDPAACTTEMFSILIHKKYIIILSSMNLEHEQVSHTIMTWFEAD
jgi:hypothetical protein